MNFNESRDELIIAAEIFEEGIEDWVRTQWRTFFTGFIKATVNLAKGTVPCGAKVDTCRYKSDV